MQPQRNFFALLFDFSFNQFVTPKFIRAAYAITILMAGSAALTIFGSALRPGVGPWSLLGGVFAVLIFFFYIIVARVVLEAILAVFRIAENTAVIAHNAQQQSSPPPQEPLP